MKTHDVYCSNNLETTQQLVYPKKQGKNEKKKQCQLTRIVSRPSSLCFLSHLANTIRDIKG
jgi:hypothetical protein